MEKLAKAAFFLSILLPLAFQSVGEDTLTPSRPLSEGQILISSGGTFALGFFNPNNSNNRYIGIWYHNIPVQTVVWVANRHKPITRSPANLTITADGSLAIVENNSTINWSTPTSGLGNPVAQLLDEGNFVVREANSNNFAWQSFDYPTDTLLAGMKLGRDLRTGLIWNLTSWASPVDPSPGEYTYLLDTRGIPTVKILSSSGLIWRGGPWVGKFAGSPNYFNFTLVYNKDEIYYYVYGFSGLISRLVMNHTGLAQRSVWSDQLGMWTVLWFAPNDLCDQVSRCGPFGICNPSNAAECGCLPGFEPKPVDDWAFKDGSQGCIRKTRLDCRTDGFVKVSGVKLPDTSNSTLDLVMSLDECRAKCLHDCSCTAYTLANISGTGCVIWTVELTDIRVFTDGGNDFQLRVAAADIGTEPVQYHKVRHSTVRVVAIVVSVVVAVIVFVSCLVCRKMRKKRNRALDMYNIVKDSRGNDFELPIMDVGIVSAATNNFSDERKLGEGGFGPVYKGILGDGQEIAVKRLSKNSVQGLEEFMTEVMLIAKLQHRNLVRLLGCCIQGEERMLVYEYMPNKSLDTMLFDDEKRAMLDWQTRYNIIVAIARGILYLHQDSVYRIIHRDLKASNVLLDKEMNPKISDFGMARIFGGDVTKSRTKRVVGTYGYMSPEYVIDGIFSAKSDVFSFGVLVLEIISGVKNKGVYQSEPHKYLLGHAWSLWNEGKAMQLVDAAAMGNSFAMTQALRSINVGLLCVQEYAEDRPTMSSVVSMLIGDNVFVPMPKQPGFFGRNVSPKMQQELDSVNDATFTMTVGR